MMQDRINKMRDNMGDLSIICNGFDWLGDRARENNQNKTLMIQYGVAPVLVHGMAAHINDESTQRFACYTVYFLGLIPELRDPLVNAGIINAICNAMKRHKNQERLLFNACASLAQLVSNEDNVPDAINEGVENLVRAAIAFKPNTDSSHYTGTTKSWGDLVLAKCQAYRNKLAEEKKRLDEEEAQAKKREEEQRRKAEELLRRNQEQEERKRAAGEEERSRKNAEEEEMRRRVEEQAKEMEMKKRIEEEEEKRKKEKDLMSISSEVRRMMEEIKMQGGESSLNRGKIMMTGPGRAGKSATVRSLKGQSFDPNLESTIGADASATCTVSRSENVVNWEEKKIESTFAEHVATLVKKKAQGSSSNEHEATKVKRPSMIQRIRNSITSLGRRKSVTASSNEDTYGIDSSAAADSSSHAGESDQHHDVVKIPPAITLSLKDDQEAVNVHTMELVTKSVNEQQGNSSSNIALSIWDLGGQEVFYTLHHLFLTKFAVYLCIFDMRHMSSDDKQVRDKSLEYTNFWLRSIQMHANGAPIFLIGTFKDVVPSEAQHEKIDERLCDAFDLKAIAPTLVKNTKQNLVFWPIDNSKGAKGDPVIQQLRENIMDTVSKMSHIKMIVPLVWTRIYDKLMETKKRNMTLTDVIAISHKYGIVDEQQVAAMLGLFHQLGMLLHFNKTNELRDLVILEPQWIVDALTMVIRDFELHGYSKALSADLRADFSSDFKKLKNESIASVSLLYRLWRSEDGESDVDYTRRKFLVSIMEQMTLSSPWRFGEDYTELTEQSEDDFMPLLPPPTQYIIPSNLRLFRGEEVEQNLRDKISDRIEMPKFEKITDPITPNCFIVDFTQSFLPIGFFDRLICLLVAYASACFQESRTPIVANGSVLMSFGLNDFRLDEEIHKARIIVTAGDGCDHQLILRTVESMIDKLKDEIMGSLLKYRVVVIIWKNGGKKCSMVDIEKGKEAVSKNKTTVRDINEDNIKVSEFDKVWIIPEAAEQIKQVTQQMVNGKSSHIFFVHAGTDTTYNIVKKMEKDIGLYGVKVQVDMTSIETVKAGIASSMCIVILLMEGVFQEPKIEESLLYISTMLKSKRRIPIILLQEGRETANTHGEAVNPIIKQATNPIIRNMLENIDPPIPVKHRSHERVMFFNEFCGKIHKSCQVVVHNENNGSDELGSVSVEYVCFWSHYKSEAGITARLLHDYVRNRCKVREEENTQILKDVKTFIDSDDLKDLRMLLEHVKKSRFFVAMLTKKYLTRPWCLAELHAALENNIPIITLNIMGGGYDFTEAKQYMETLTPESLNKAGGTTDAAAILENLGINVPELGKKLAATLPQIISISFNPLGGGRVMEAEIDTIIDRFIQ